MWNYHSYRDRTDGNSSIKALRTVDVVVKPMASLNTLSQEKLLVCHSVFGSTCWYRRSIEMPSRSQCFRLHLPRHQQCLDAPLSMLPAKRLWLSHVDGISRLPLMLMLVLHVHQ